MVQEHEDVTNHFGYDFFPNEHWADNPEEMKNPKLTQCIQLS